MLGLTVPQAAAALAATIVGYDIGLFDQSVVNAVLLLILVSIVVGTLLVERSVRRVPSPGAEDRLGHRVLVTLEDPAQAPLAFALAARIAAPDNGVVHGLLCQPSLRGRVAPGAAGRAERRRLLRRSRRRADQLLVHESLPEGVVNAAAAERASLVLVGQRPSAASAFGTAGETVAAASAAPVAILLGDAARLGRVRFAPDGDSPASKLAAELAARLGADGGRAGVEDLVPGELCVMPVASWEMLADPPEPPDGAAVLIVPET